MSASAGLPQPGVEVIQSFQTVSPTAVTPTLMPCLVGPCKQVVDAVVQGVTGGSSVNPGAQVTIPALLTSAAPTGGPPAVYTFTGSRNLIFNSNGLPNVTANFVAGTYQPADVVKIVAAALAAAGESNLIVEVNGATWRMRTTSQTDFDFITVDPTTSAEALTEFGFWAGQTIFGAGDYHQYELTIPTSDFPDPNNNLTEVAIDASTVRAFLGISGNTQLQEEMRTQSVLRFGGAVSMIDAGNGTGFSNIFHMAGENFTTTGTHAVVTGAAAPDLTGNLNDKTLILSDGRAPVTVQLPSPCTTKGEIETAINAAFNPLDGIVVTDNGTELVFTNTRLREDGLTNAHGIDSQVIFVGGSALQPTNYLDTDITPTIAIGSNHGIFQSPQPGDQLYVDGVLIGTISVVAPNGTQTQLKLNVNKPLTFTGSSFYIVAKNIQPLPAEAVNRPKPDLIVDSVGNATLKHYLLRTSKGVASQSVTATALVTPSVNMYVSYIGLRLDVTQAGSNPGLLKFSDPVTLQTQLSPITPDNPLGLAFFFALLNAPAVTITGLGVDAITASEPEGTVDAYTRAASFLEQFEVYAIAPLTHESVVHQVFQTHVDSMSQPDQKGERIVLVNPSKPTRKLDALVASGTNGNTVGGGGLLFDTGVPNLEQLLINQGISDPSAITVAQGVFLNISDNALNYNISSVSGSVVTVNVTFTGNQNEDGFYSTTDLDDAPLPSALIEDPFSIKIRGAALVLPDGVTPDKDNIAATYAALAHGFLDRRVWCIVPDKCAATIGGVEQVIDGFYMCAAIAGMIGQQPPQQSFTNFPITGFTRVIGSNDFFTPKQMNQMAAGGDYIIIQDSPGLGPLYARMALTTDLTSIETRTDSITKIVDFCGKFYRTGLKNFIGRFNINQGLLDSLGHVLQGLTEFLKGAGVLIGATVNNLIQDTSAPDTVLVDITLDVPFPCNYIRITLVI